ncbi:MAG: DNA-3-methyladenine glycosylase I [Myxococcaceae bacterium]|nr:DNA-3-methyladenine glycosylase I [Myxococcaceae bacterium]MBH2005747.1 DNA-3-methyladenine glycosylase I [Myxococcaceae bacterium]
MECYNRIMILKRCGWCLNDPLYVKYHDEEWGVPVYDDAKIFEFLILEGAQAGLSWLTILKRRENYRRAFAHFDAQQVAQFSERDVQALMLDAGIIRNQLKIRSAISNAQAFLKVQNEWGTFSKYIWGFVDGEPIVNHPQTLKDLKATSPESDALSQDLKRRGFKFVGSTIVYAHMQATGLVQDHLQDCFKNTQASN